MNYSSVYLKTDATLEEVVKIAHDVLGRQRLFWREDSPDGPVYVTMHGDRRISLARNIVVGTDDEPLNEYTFDLDFDGHDDFTRLRYARRVYTKLAKRYPLPLLLTDNLVEVGRFDPPEGASSAEALRARIAGLDSGISDRPLLEFNPATGFWERVHVDVSKPRNRRT